MFDFIVNLIALQVIAVMVFQMAVFFSASRKVNTVKFLGMTALYGLIPFVGLTMIVLSAVMAYRGVSERWFSNSSLFEQLAAQYEE